MKTEWEIHERLAEIGDAYAVVCSEFDKGNVSKNELSIERLLFTLRVETLVWVLDED